MTLTLDDIKNTYCMTTWGTNGGLQTCGPLSVSAGTTMALTLRSEGYRDAAARRLTDGEATAFYAKTRTEQLREARARRKALAAHRVAA